MKVGRYMVILILFAALLITFGNRGLWDSYRMNQRLCELQDSNETIVRENAALKQEIDLLETNLSYIEMIARNELGMVKQGDIVFRISK